MKADVPEPLHRHAGAGHPLNTWTRPSSTRIAHDTLSTRLGLARTARHVPSRFICWYTRSKYPCAFCHNDEPPRPTPAWP